MKKSTRTARSVLSGILAFLMSLGIVLTTLCLAMAYMAHSPSFTIRVLKHSEYTKHLTEELKEEFISYGSAANVDESFFEDFLSTELTVEKVEADTNRTIHEFYTGNPEPIQTDAMHDDLYERFKKYATEKGLRLDEGLLEDLDHMATELCEFYEGYVSLLSNSYFSAASSALARVRPLTFYGAGAGLLVVFLTGLFLILFYKHADDWLAFFIYAFSGASLMLLTAPLIALCTGVANRISIGSAAMYSFATGMLNGVLITVVLSALLPILATVILSIFYVRASKRRQEKHEAAQHDVKAEA